MSRFNLVINPVLGSLDVYSSNGSKLYRAFSSVVDARKYLGNAGIRGRNVDEMVKKFENFKRNNKSQSQVQSFSGSIVENKGKKIVNPETGEVFVLGSRRGRVPGFVKKILMEQENS